MSFRKSILTPLASLIVAIIVVFTAGTLWSIWLINGQKGDGLVINISGAQRMLSQKMTKEVTGIVNELYASQPGASERIQAYQLALRKSRNRYHKALTLLVNGGEFTNSDKSIALVPATKNPKILPVLLEVRSIWKPFNESIDFFLRRDIDPETPGFQNMLQRIVDNNLDLLAKMHKVTGLYQAAAEAKM